MPAVEALGEAVGPAAAAGRGPAAAAAEAAAERHARIAVLVDLAAVVAGALVLVGQQVIGLGHLGEALGGLGIVLVAVGVQLLGEAAIGLLDLGLARPALDAQLLVKVHSVPSARRPFRSRARIRQASLSLDSAISSGQRPGMADDPIALFDAWFAEAKASEPNDPDAMALATATPTDGRRCGWCC